MTNSDPGCIRSSTSAGVPRPSRSKMKLPRGRVSSLGYSPPRLSSSTNGFLLFWVTGLRILAWFWEGKKHSERHTSPNMVIWKSLRLKGMEPSA